MKLYLFVIVATFSLASACAEGPQGLEIVDIKAELDSDTQERLIGDSHNLANQEEPRKPGEFEGDDFDDEEFNEELCLNEPSPNLPNKDEASRIVEKQMASMKMPDDVKKFDAESYDSKVSYWKPAYWWPIWKCCPRVFNYGCRSATTRLGVFRHWFNYKREWCYPLTRIYIRRCLCSECQIRNFWCPRKGSCNRRYTRFTFLALCNRWGYGWGYLRVIYNKWLPTSCYCRANKYIHTVNTVKKINE